MLEMATHRPRKDTPKRGTPINVSQDEILKVLCNHEGYSDPDLGPSVTVREGLFNMMDVTPYGLSAADQKELWQEESIRLASAVTDLNTPLSFVGTKDLAHDTKDGYETLANIANQAWVAMNITIHDSQAILTRHYPDLALEKMLKDSRGVLEDFVGGDDDEDYDNADNVTTECTWSPSVNANDYNELVNYLTATLARVYCKAASGTAWLEHVLAHLVMISTKLKVVSFALSESVSTSLEMSSDLKKNQPSVPYGRGVGRHNGGDGALGQADDSEVRGPLQALNHMLNSMDVLKTHDQSKVGPKTKWNAVRDRYWVRTSKYLMPIQLVVRHILISLRGQNPLATTSNTSYELSGILYDSMFGEFSTYVYQDVNGEYLGGSKPENINVAHAVFEVLGMTMKMLKDDRDSKRKTTMGHTGSRTVTWEDPSTQSGTVIVQGTSSTDENLRDPTQLVGTIISWQYTAVPASQPQSQDGERGAPVAGGVTVPEESLSLISMCEVISVMVPLLAGSPKVIEYITDFIQMSAYTAASDKISLFEPLRYKGSFCLNTDVYRDAWSKQPNLVVSGLSRAIMVGDGLLSYKKGETIPILSYKTQPALLPIAEDSREKTDDKEVIRRRQQKVEKALRKMNGWVVEENGVRVRCALYVWTTIVIASTLVLGGIAAGIAIKNRMDPVDPFNVTMYCWVVAAFTVLIAKSLLVAEWPWRDFLRSQVLCRSASELHSVSGIDDQLILAKLLHDESDSRLQTRGPYNSVFKRKSDSADGFSIDQPISMRTMLLSGLIMIQVRAHHGEFLVCLDLRKGTEYDVIPHENYALETEGLIVSDSVPDKEPQPRTAKRRIPLKVTKELRWGQIVGVFGESECLFT